jgi:hypothetical protein
MKNLFIKKINVLGILILLVHASVNAQWVTSGTSIYYNRGNVGVGTTAPNHQFSVFGTGALAQMNIFNTRAGSGQTAGLRLHTPSGWNVMLRTVQDIAWLELSDVNGGWVHRWNAGDYFTKGRIGVGTTNLGTYMLSVNGGIRAKEIVVESGWADFVFDDKYKLRSLAEIEAFIKQNKHLPEIPSAKEVKKNGVNLGDMESKLLMKIEELTLYLISLQKQNDDFRKELSMIKDKSENIK